MTTHTQAPANPLIARVDSLTAQLTEADTQLEAAQEQVAQRRAEAISTALAARDLAHCLGNIVYREDTDYRTAMGKAALAERRMDIDRIAVVHATVARDTLAKQLAQVRQALRVAQHREAVLAANPELARRLDLAEKSLADAKQATGRDAKVELQQAEFWLTKAQEKIEAACRATPMGR